MTDRTVIRLEEWSNGSDDVRVNFRPEEPDDVPSRLQWRTLTCDPATAPFVDLKAIAAGAHDPLDDELVKAVGEAIHAALSQHPGVAQALDRAANVPGDQVHPMHLLTSAMEAESIPWEALHHPTGRFLGLDERFAISRAVSTGGGRLERQHDAPLRIAAVLAAADRDARGEWEAMHDAITASGLETHVTLFLSQLDFLGEVQAAGEARVDARPVPPAKDELIAALEAVRPHVVHVYSHGSGEAGGYLEVDGAGDFDDQKLYLEPADLARLREEAWLIVLDACEGATATSGVHSLAYTLVERGVPAAIGMREVIASTDASTFCRAFYTAALGALAQELTPGSDVVVDWARYLSIARGALCGRLPGPPGMTASKQKPWTLPVLYRRAEDLVVHTPKVAHTHDAETRARLLGELEVYRQALSQLHPDNPPIVRQQLEAAIAQLEADLESA